MNSNTTDKGTITWQSPSNIALVKYWGKHGKQLPRNPSLSMTLNASYTTTSLIYKKKNPEKGCRCNFCLTGNRIYLLKQELSAT